MEQKCENPDKKNSGSLLGFEIENFLIKIFTNLSKGTFFLKNSCNPKNYTLYGRIHYRIKRSFRIERFLYFCLEKFCTKIFPKIERIMSLQIFWYFVKHFANACIFPAIFGQISVVLTFLGHYDIIMVIILFSFFKNWPKYNKIFSKKK